MPKYEHQGTEQLNVSDELREALRYRVDMLLNRVEKRDWVPVRTISTWGHSHSKMVTIEDIVCMMMDVDGFCGAVFVTPAFNLTVRGRIEDDVLTWSFPDGTPSI